MYRCDTAWGDTGIVSRRKFARGKALRVAKPAFPPRAPPFRARILRRTLWNVLRYWLGDVLQGVEAVRLSRWMRADGKAARAAGLFPVFLLKSIKINRGL